ncbi:MAG: Ig-like domain-containing protein [Lachnospiraceae bacterium]|nr:Ig-like domain-containing protein [Lachnospiraceae bacterium]
MPRSTADLWDFTADSPFGILGDTLTDTTAYVDGLYVEALPYNYSGAVQIKVKEGGGISLTPKAVIYVPIREGKKLLINAPTGFANIKVNGTVLSSSLRIFDTGSFAAGSDRQGYVKVEAIDEDPYQFNSSDEVAVINEISWLPGDWSGIVIPTAAEDLTYNGEEQTGVAAGAGYTLSGTFKATDADTYTATAKLKAEYVAGGFKWSDNTTDDKTITWSIGKAAHAGVTASGSARYGKSGTVDLSTLIVDGGTVGVITTTDADSVLSGVPTVAEEKLSFAFADDAGKAGKTATVTVPVTSKSYEDYNITATLTVRGKETPVLTAQNITRTYDGKAVTDAQIVGTAKVNGTNVPGTWAFKSGQGLTEVADSGEKTVVFTPADTENYVGGETTLKLTINAPAPDPVNPDNPTPVQPDASSVSFAKRSLVLEEGKSEKLSWTVLPADAKDKSVTFTSSDEKIVKVDAVGSVTGVSTGTAKVTVRTTVGGYTDECVVTVGKAGDGEKIKEAEEVSKGDKIVEAKEETKPAEGSVKIKGETVAVNVSTTWKDAVDYTGKKIDAKDLLGAKVDTTAIEKSLTLNKKAEKKGKTAADLIKVTYVCKNKAAGEATFYAKIEIAKDASKYLSKSEFNKLKKEVKAINKKLKAEKCSFTINKRSVTDGTLLVKVAKTGKGAVKTKKGGNIDKVNSVKLKTKNAAGKDITISLSKKDYDIELVDAASGLVRVTGKNSFTGSITVYVQ